MRPAIALLTLFVATAYARAAQDPEILATDASLLDQLRSHRGAAIDVDSQAALGRFLRLFRLVPADATRIDVTDGLLERAEATHRYFSTPRYFPGKRVLAVDEAMGWPTHRAFVKEILPGGNYSVEIEEVLEYDERMAPLRTRTVRRNLSPAELARLNSGTALEPGRSYFSIRYDPVNDPILRETLAAGDRIVDEHFPDFRKPLEEVARQQHRLFLELMRLGKALDYPSSGRDPVQARRAAELQRDPYYSANRQLAGAFLKGGAGACFAQASLAVQIVNSVARPAGIDMQLVRGETLADRTGHGFAMVNFRGEPTRYVSDPAWEGSLEWHTWNPPEGYRGQLLLDVQHAFAAAGWGRNRRMIDTEGPRIATPAPPPWRARESALTREAIGAGRFAAAYLLKESFAAWERSDAAGLREAAAHLGTGSFWGSLALFTGVARAAEVGISLAPLPRLASRLSRAVLPLASGMAAVQVLSGGLSPRDLALSTAAYLSAGVLVSAVSDFAFPALFAGATPPGRIARGVLGLVRMAAVLYLGEKIEHGLRRRLAAPAPPCPGIRDSLDALTAAGSVP